LTGGVLDKLKEQVGEVINSTAGVVANITGWTDSGSSSGTTNSTGGSNSTTTPSASDPCADRWSGIICSATGVITGMYVPRLVVVLRPLELLHSLRHPPSVLDGLELTGSIPTGLEELPDLTTLYVNHRFAPPHAQQTMCVF
jgi:hypothetical protein